MVEVPDARRHPEPSGGPGPLSLPLVPSYAALCAVQAAVAAAPTRRASERGLGLVGLAAPAVALGAGVAILHAVAWGPRALALLATFATPALAGAAGFPTRSRTPWLWPPAAAAAWVVAWRTHGLLAQAAEVLLIAAACLAIAGVAALVAPAWSLESGLILLAAVDVVLVWGTPQVEPATTALHGVAPPRAAGAPLPRLQDATFGSALMGWLDLLAPALLGVAASGRRRLIAAAATATAAGLWGLLLLATSQVAATVPVLAGVVALRLRRRRV